MIYILKIFKQSLNDLIFEYIKNNKYELYNKLYSINENEQIIKDSIDTYYQKWQTVSFLSIKLFKNLFCDYVL